MTRLIPSAPVLTLVSVGASTISLSWTDISLPGIPVSSYTLYRGTGAIPTSFTPVVTQVSTLLTYTDSGLSANTTYTYYVVGLYATGGNTSWSNFVSGTTVAIKYLYTLPNSFIDIYDVSSPASVSRVAHISSADSAGQPQGSYSDGQYLWMLDNYNLLCYDIHTDPLLPSKVSSVPEVRQFIIRRNLSTRNNLLMTVTNHLGTLYYNSLDITNPASPVAKTTVPATGGFPGLQEMIFDPTGRVIIVDSNNFNNTQIYSLPVNADLTLGSLSTITGGLDALGRQWKSYAVLYKGYYIVQFYNTIVGSYRLTDGNAGTYGWGSPAGGGWGFYFARLIGKYLFIANSVSNAGSTLVDIINVDTNAYLYYLGPTSAICTGMHIAGNLLFFTSGTSLYIYDISQTLASGGAPILLNTVTGLANAPFGLGGYLSSGWEGNNGGCTT